MIAFYACEGCEQIEMQVKTVECTLWPFGVVSALSSSELDSFGLGRFGLGRFGQLVGRSFRPDTFKVPVGTLG